MLFLKMKIKCDVQSGLRFTRFSQATYSVEATCSYVQVEKTALERDTAFKVVSFYFLCVVILC